MIFRKLGDAEIELSVIALGGHEYLPDGRSRAFNEDSSLAIQPGYLFDGFGQDKRKAVLRAAYDHGINLFDVTIDSEKEALGRNLKEMPPPYDVYIQTRPEGMVYGYDQFNLRMAQYDLLKAEVQRILKLLGRETLDYFNIAFMQAALDHDPEYLGKINHNIEALKQEGLIRYACADTFSGESTYLKQIAAGCFDAVYVNFNLADDAGRHRILHAARERGMGVITREPFMKGALFRMGDDVGLTNQSELARISLKWNLGHRDVTLAVMGVDNPEQLEENLAILVDLKLDGRERDIIEQLKQSRTFQEYSAQKATSFGYPSTSELG